MSLILVSAHVESTESGLVAMPEDQGADTTGAEYNHGFEKFGWPNAKPGG